MWPRGRGMPGLKAAALTCLEWAHLIGNIKKWLIISNFPRKCLIVIIKNVVVLCIILIIIITTFFKKKYKSDNFTICNPLIPHRKAWPSLLTQNTCVVDSPPGWWVMSWRGVSPAFSVVCVCVCVFYWGEAWSIWGWNAGVHHYEVMRIMGCLHRGPTRCER